MARTVFDGFGRWLIVDRGELMAHPSKRVHPSKGAEVRLSRLVEDCHTVWGIGSTLSEGELPERQVAAQTSAARRPAAIVDAQSAAVSDQVVALRRAAASGAAFCEICEKTSEQA